MKHIIRHNFSVTKEDRISMNGHKPLLLWFTGLSGSGKSTLANAVEEKLFKKKIATYTLDGDNVRKGLNNNLTFSPEDRTENIRRIAEVSNLMIDAGLVVLAAFVSPYLEDRENIKEIVGSDNFIEIFVNTPVAECEHRDVKGLYAKARAGEIKNFTGISAPYEAPIAPDITINTIETTVEDAITQILQYIEPKLKPNG